MLLERLRFGKAGKNVLVLATYQGLLFSINTVFAMVSGLVGATLAPDPALATVPLGLFITGAALTTYPASILMGRIGRRAGFLIGDFRADAPSEQGREGVEEQVGERDVAEVGGEHEAKNQQQGHAPHPRLAAHQPTDVEVANGEGDHQ